MSSLSLRVVLLAGALEILLAPLAWAQTPPLPRSQDGHVLHAPFRTEVEEARPDPTPAPEEEAPETDAPPAEAPTGPMVYRSSPPEDGGLVQDTAADVSLDERTGPEPMLHYHAIFDPSVAPWKRNNARDQITPEGGLIVRDPTRQPIAISPRENLSERGLWYADITVELKPGALAPIPSLAPGMQIRAVESSPDLPELRFSTDSAGNFGAEANFKGRARLLLLVDAPGSYFHGTLPAGILTRDAWRGAPGGRPEVPQPIRQAAQRLWSDLGVSPDLPLATTLPRLVGWFRSFTPGPLPPREQTLLETLVRGQRGVCRHRAHAFVILAQSLGIPARHVANEAHAFVEVQIPGAEAGWRRIDLGGGADGLTLHGEQRPRHQVNGEDPFPRPRTYVAGATTLPSRQGSDPLEGLASPTEPVHELAQPLPWRAQPPLPAALPGQIPTRIQILEANQSVLRGDSMKVDGIITSQTGAPVAGLPVWLQLISMDKAAEEVLQIGATHSDEEGRFSAHVNYPVQLPIGRYRLQARTPGDARRAAAISSE